MITEIFLTKQIPPSDSVILLAHEKSDFRSFFTEAEQQYISSCINRKKFHIPINKYDKWIFLVIISKPEKDKNDHIEGLRRTGHQVFEATGEITDNNIFLTTLKVEKEELMAFAEGFILSSYTFDEHKKKEEDTPGINSLYVKSESFGESEKNELLHLSQGIFLARDLVNQPLNYLSATQLAEEAYQRGHEAGVKVNILDKEQISALGMGGLLAVNKGSIDPPTFTIMEWKPESPVNAQPVVLVGKGIVYDTGGLSLKPTPNSMDYMKSDMGGTAAVIASVYATALEKLPVHVIGLIPSTDNRPDGNAYVPGDIITMHDKTTVEVMNTDAEGRMVLADALSYARKYNPSLVIDIATLTGSAAMAIGKYGIVGMGNAKQEIIDQISESGNNTNERVVWFPFWDEYKELLKSTVADLKNIGGREAGAITAGKFLEHFTSYPYIHLDIAGGGWVKEQYNYRGTGGTGIGTRLIFNFLKNF
ncbi:MAG: leucyl aminopeptidase family protein [Bacteroidota bacterium]